MKKEIIIPLLLVSLIFNILLIAKNHKSCEFIKETKNRKAEHAIHKLILERQSPHAMSGEPITNDELMSLFEAARWAPSSYNDQPWRFIYGYKDSAAWTTLFDTLVPFNQSWAKNAGVLILVLSNTLSEKTGRPAPTHAYDAGAAAQNLALQAHAMGLVVHQMEGFNYEKAREAFAIPAQFTVLAIIAVGKPGSTRNLPEYLQKMQTPSGRKTIDQFAFEGEFKN